LSGLSCPFRVTRAAPAAAARTYMGQTRLADVLDQQQPPLPWARVDQRPAPPSPPPDEEIHRSICTSRRRRPQTQWRRCRVARSPRSPPTGRDATGGRACVQQRGYSRTLVLRAPFSPAARRRPKRSPLRSAAASLVASSVRSWTVAGGLSAGAVGAHGAVGAVLPVWTRVGSGG